MGRDKEPTFVFEGGNAYALVDGKVVASASTAEELEAKLASEDDPFGEDSTKNTCTGCGADAYTKDGECADCRADRDDNEKNAATATHIETPNGLKGKIMGRVKDVWGETVTVRFANGRIVQIPVTDGLTFTAEAAEAPANPIEGLEQRLENGSDDLDERKAELEAIKSEARTHILKGASAADEDAFHKIAVEADFELGEVNDAIAQRESDEAEAFEPYNPGIQVVEQESVGGNDSRWLDNAVSDMMAEAESVDYGRLLEEGPEDFAAGLDDAVLADSGTVRQLASSFIEPKTALAEADIRDQFRSAWLDRVESRRRIELKNRQSTQKKEAATQKESFDSSPDESLFF